MWKKLTLFTGEKILVNFNNIIDILPGKDSGSSLEGVSSSCFISVKETVDEIEAMLIPVIARDPIELDILKQELAQSKRRLEII